MVRYSNISVLYYIVVYRLYCIYCIVYVRIVYITIYTLSDNRKVYILPLPYIFTLQKKRRKKNKMEKQKVSIDLIAFNKAIDKAKEREYKNAVFEMAFSMDNLKIDVFKMSLILAILYGQDKERTLNDLVKAREDALK